MKKHIKYPKIAQFRNIVTNINKQSTFVKMDGDTPIFDNTLKRPILKFKGTVKLHGTNAGICYNAQEGIWAQSRENIITPEKDNAGFAFFVEGEKSYFENIFDILFNVHYLSPEAYTLSIFGEWAGKGIQKSVGISQLDKAFYIFGVKVSKPQDEDFNSYWVDISMLKSLSNERVFCIEDYPTYEIEIDFNIPQLSQNELIKITQKVEEECPVSKARGIDGIGEGVVWSCEYKDAVYRFKVKGEKHSISKVKKLATIDAEKLNSINEFIEYAVTKNRFNQAIENIFPSNHIDIKKLGDLIRWVIKDIASEEVDTLVKNNLEPKNVNKYISQRVREMFFKLEI